VTVPTDGGTVLRSRLFIKYVVLLIAGVSLVLVANAVLDVYEFFRFSRQALERRGILSKSAIRFQEQRFVANDTIEEVPHWR
jgi:hypothetical protein